MPFLLASNILCAYIIAINSDITRSLMQNMIYTNCSVATMVKGGEPYGLLDNAAIVVSNERVAWVGKSEDIPVEFVDIEREDLDGKLVTPALIDCHTHLVFGGTRAQEFEARLKGASYQEIARGGGGIVSTVIATRSATDEQLIEQSLERLDDLINEGVAVVEIKSGYGLTIEDELRMLRIARKLATLRPVKVITTWLAAHAIPPEYLARADQYIDEVAIPGLRKGAAQGLIDAVDGFCEEIAFSAAQIERLFVVAKSLNIPVKLHAEQLTDQKGALLTAKYKGLSADHLEYLAEADIQEFAASGAVAVLLPGAFYTLRETKLPPIDCLRKYNVDIAIATDCNPGSSPLSSILTAMNMACKEFLMTPEEALTGVTRSAAKALNLSDDYGVVAAGAIAELAVWDLKHPAELAYWIGGSRLNKRISPLVNI
ncbi:MAG: imidazolonepropionase [Glaciecola sp.]